MPSVTDRYCLLDALPAPIKGRAPPPATPTPFPLSPKPPPAIFHARAELEPPPFFLTIVPLHRRLSCYGEPTVGFASSPSSSPALASELWRLIVPDTPCAGDAVPCYCPHCPLGPPWTRPRCRSTAPWT
jgi:hypothetical protein